MQPEVRKVRLFGNPGAEPTANDAADLQTFSPCLKEATFRYCPIETRYLNLGPAGSRGSRRGRIGAATVEECLRQIGQGARLQVSLRKQTRSAGLYTEQRRDRDVWIHSNALVQARLPKP